MKKIYNLTIEPLTAVHVGSGEELLPLDYTLAAPGNSAVSRYVKFDSDKVIDGIIKSGKQNLISELENVNNENNVNKLGSLLRKYFYMGVSYDASITKGFKKLYSEKISGNLLDNSIAAQQMMHEDNKPYIPGSSIKGAVRTAVLNHILRDEIDDDSYNELDSMQNKEKNEKQIQNMILQILKEDKGNDAQKDPFRCVEISDSIFSARSQLVGQMMNAKINKATNELDFVSMQIIAETIPGILAGNKTSANFVLRINEDLQNLKSDEFHINKKIDLKEIAKSCNAFFKEQFAYEYKKFYQKAYDGIDKIVELKKAIDSIDENDENKFLLRLGRWSQVEYVTLDDFKNPKTPTRKGKTMPAGTTRTLFDLDGQYLPLGWVVCKVE